MTTDRAALTFGSLFAGIGGIDLGLERAGMACKWQVEKDNYALKVLEKHWPCVPRYTDVCGFLGGKRWRRVCSAWAVDCIAGGFPCQDISNAGRRAGIDGKRSGLWSEFARIIHLLRPRYVLVENVDALAVRGLDRVLGDLAALGFDAEWDRIPAASVGAPHRRWRIFIVAYAKTVQRPAFVGSQQGGTRESLAANAASNGREQGRTNHGEKRARRRDADRSVIGSHVSDANNTGLEIGGSVERNSREELATVERGCREALPDTESRWSGQRWREQFAAYCASQRDLFWPDPEPWLRRVDDGLCPTMDGVASRVDRLRCLGNAVVPQIAEWIGRSIVADANH